MLRLALTAALLATGCAPDDTSAADRLAGEVEDAIRDTAPVDAQADGVAFSATVDGDNLESLLTTDGKVELGLTDRVVYSRLSKETQAEITDQAREAAGQEEGFGGRIARAATEALAQNIGTAVQVPLDDIRDVRVEGDRLVIEMADGGASPFDAIKTDDAPILDRIDPADARSLADAFQATRQ